MTVVAIDPLHPPKHETFVAVPPTVMLPPADVTVTVAVVVGGVLHAAVPVTVTVYVPGQRPVAVCPVPPEGAHE